MFELADNLKHLEESDIVGKRDVGGARSKWHGVQGGG